MSFYSSQNNNNSMVSYKVNPRYPTGISRPKYCGTVGKLRQNQIYGIIRKLFPKSKFTVKNNYHGADIEIYSNLNVPLARFEIKNERYSSYFNIKEWNNIRWNLGNFRIPKTGVIASFGNFKDCSVEDNVLPCFDLCLLGYQTLPREYYNFYVKSGNREYYRVDNHKSYIKLKRQIIEFLVKLGLLKNKQNDRCTSIHVCSYMSTNILYSIFNRILGFFLVVPVALCNIKAGFKGKSLRARKELVIKSLDSLHVCISSNSNRDNILGSLINSILEFFFVVPMHCADIKAMFEDRFLVENGEFRGKSNNSLPLGKYLAKSRINIKICVPDFKNEILKGVRNMSVDTENDVYLWYHLRSYSKYKASKDSIVADDYNLVLFND